MVVLLLVFCCLRSCFYSFEIPWSSWGFSKPQDFSAWRGLLSFEVLVSTGFQDDFRGS